MAGLDGSSGSGTSGTVGTSDGGSADTSSDGTADTAGSDPVAEAARRSAINQAVQLAGMLPTVAVDPKHAVDCMSACPSSNANGWACQSTRYVEARAFDRLSVFQSASPQLWPGNVVNGARALKGELVPLAVNLAPQTFSVSLENIAGNPTGMMQHPSLSAFRTERNRILSTNVTGATSAAISYNVEDISTESQLNFAVGASFPLKGIVDISAGFDFSSGSKTSKVLLDFTQIYYSFDLDSPKTPADFFTADTTAAALAALFSSSEPPAYIESVLFGRRILVAFESTDTRQTLHAAVKAAADVLKVGGSLDAGSQKAISHSTMKAVIIGGSGDAAAAAVTNGIDGIKALIGSGGNYTKDSPGAAIGFNLAYLDNTPVKTVISTDYVDTTCTRTSVTVQGSLDAITDLTPDLDGTSEFYGFVEVLVPSATYDGRCPTTAGALPGFSLMNYARGMYYQLGETDNGMAASVPVDANKFICIRAHLFEADVLSDDDYGFAQAELPWGDWEGTHKLQLRNDGSAADVAVTVTLP
jgi:thiol-activated cytolysin